MSEKVVMNVSETAEALGISRTSLYNLMHADNDFPIIKVGTRRLVPVAGLKAWVEKHTELSRRQ